MMAQNKPHSLETKAYDERNSCSSSLTPKTLGPIGMVNGQPTRQMLISRYPDYALQQNSAGVSNTRITTIPHGLTNIPWDSPLSSPPPQPPWTPSLSVGHSSYRPSTSPPYPLDTTTTTTATTPSLFSDYQDIASVPMLPETSKEPIFREQRSRSYTTEHDSSYYTGTDPWAYNYTDSNQNSGGFYNNNHRPSSLYTMPEESTDMMHPPPSPFNTPFFFNASHSHTLPRYQNDGNADDDPMAFHRTRSKSSAPAFNIWDPSDPSTTELNTRWIHQPTFNQPPPSLYTPFLSASKGQQLGPTRRFSVQPSSFNPISFPMKDGDRRHSMAGPTLSHDDYDDEPAFIMTSLADSIDELTQPIESIDNEQPTTSSSTSTSSPLPPASATVSSTTASTSSKDLYAKVAAAGITEVTPRPLQHPEPKQELQVDSPSTTTPSPYYNLPKSDDMGKGIKLESIPKDAKFYIVEFKAGRTDIFFSPLGVKVGDLVMVEADRGHDLGKVMVDAKTPGQLAQYTQQQQHDSSQPDKPVQQRNDLRIKRLFRLARPEEITQLISKSEDELKALSTCQARVQQRKLNINVVNAEFQMDRRKLIFYFVAEKRVDFRELVRDLFKVYKTRIWMCAVNNNKKSIMAEDAPTT